VTDAFKNTLAWLLIGTIGVFMAMNWATASFTGAEFLPAGNDSFYHARRILDAYENPSTFYEFDPRIHVPEGSWVTWPWLFDYLIARVLRVLMGFSEADNPVEILVYIPVFWSYVTVGLVIAICSALKMSWTSRIIAGLVAALLPLNQALHGVGLVDHHFMEYTFVLLALLGSVRWFSRPSDKGRAAFLGFVLGIAPGFHTALFILQLPVLGIFFLLWLKRWQPGVRSTFCFCLFLLLGSLFVLLPSQAFLHGSFNFYQLSWFQFYIAVLSSFMALYVSRRRANYVNVIALIVLGALALIPVLNQVVLVSNFFSKSVAALDKIEEARSLFSMLSDPNGPVSLFSLYSLFLIAVPFVIAGSLWVLFRYPEPGDASVAVFALFGASMMIAQFRFHYFGSWTLYLPLLLVVDRQLAKKPRAARRFGYIALAAVAVIAIIPSAKYRLFASYTAGLDPHYRIARYFMPTLAERCAEKPGAVLSWNDSGHYIRYHTECSVIANNFLLTDQHSEKIKEMESLMSMPLGKVLDERPDIRYLMIYYPLVTMRQDDGTKTVMNAQQLIAVNQPWTLVLMLLNKEDPEQIDTRLEFLQQVVVEGEEGQIVVGRLFEVKQLSLEKSRARAREVISD
jgi:asparagine N-glycosylation enzyme membrane subunit Stt3